MMNSGNSLFVFSVILVPVLLISVNYTAIHDYYTYSLPLNNMKITYSKYGVQAFDVIQNKADSTCFTTPSQNYFCYNKPRMFEDNSGAISYIAGSNGVEGELHFDPVGTGHFYFTIRNMTQINDDSALVTLSDRNYQAGNIDTVTYKIIPKFEFSKMIKKFDTFVSNCDNYEGTDITIVQYLGIKTMNNTDYFMTWHTNANSTQGIKCDYPQIIQHSFNHNFRGL